MKKSTIWGKCENQQSGGNPQAKKMSNQNLTSKGNVKKTNQNLSHLKKSQFGENLRERERESRESFDLRVKESLAKQKKREILNVPRYFF